MKPDALSLAFSRARLGAPGWLVVLLVCVELLLRLIAAVLFLVGAFGFVFLCLLWKWLLALVLAGGVAGLVYEFYRQRKSAQPPKR